MRLIEHIVEPKKLLLSWQSSRPEHGRQRLFVAELLREGDNANLVYLDDSSEFAQAKEWGFRGYPGFNVGNKIHQCVLASFMKRLPPRSREDFSRFLDALRIKADAKISDFALLGYSGAKLPDDDFTIIHTFEDAEVPLEFLMPVQGYRHYANELPIFSLTTEMEAFFEIESDNIKDPQAIKVIIDGEMAGYVCRGLTNTLHKWIASNQRISAYVERINGTEHKPQIYLYVSII